MITKKRLILSFIVFALMLVTFSFSVHAETVADGTVYYSSSWSGGSGNSNVVSAKNPYITEERTVIVNGYSFLDENGSVLASAYEPSSEGFEVPHEAPTGTVKTMVHIHSLTNRLGWVDKTEILSEVANDEMLTPESFAERVDNLQDSGKTLIYVDKSGSMDNFVKEATSAFEKLDFSNTKVVVFAETSKVISKDDINEEHNVGVLTDLYSALRFADEYLPGVENIVLITDLCDTENNILKDMPSQLKNIQILCPTNFYPKDQIYKIKESWTKANISVSIIK